MKNNILPGGRLLLIGGAADTCDTNLVKLAGGADSRILLIPHASGYPDEVSQEATAVLEAAGCKSVSTLMPADQFQIPRGTTAVYMLGGDQSRLVEKLGRSGRDRLLAFLSNGGLVAGSSAGTACIGEKMISGGMPDGLLEPGSLKTSDGLGLLKNVLFDQHFRNRNRFNRLMVGVATLANVTGVGIDEDTAVLIDPDGSVQVLGVGQVTLFQPTDSTFSQQRHSRLNARNVLVSCFSPGTSFSLATLQS